MHRIVVSGFMPRLLDSRHKAARYIAVLIAFLCLGTPQVFPANHLRVHMLSGSAEYKSEESLKIWAKHLEEKFDVKSTFSLGTDRSKTVAGLEYIQEADILVILCRRWELEEEQAAIVRQSIESGKPVLAIRTASHAFEFYKEFDKEILGGDYQGHGKKGEVVEVLPCSDNSDHPILVGVSGWTRTGKIYRNPHPAKDISLLLSARAGDLSLPMAWIRINDNQRVFYTTMGFPEEFLNPQFIKLLDNALLWIAQS